MTRMLASSISVSGVLERGWMSSSMTVYPLVMESSSTHIPKHETSSGVPYWKRPTLSNYLPVINLHPNPS